MTEHEQSHDVLGAEEERPPLGPLSRAIGIIFSPTETFADIARHPTWAFILIVTIALSSAALFLLQFRIPNIETRYKELIRQQIEETLEKRGAAKPPQEALDRQVEMQARLFRFLPLLPVGAIPIVALFLAGVFFLGLLLLQAETTFKKTFSVVSWSYGVTSSIGALLSLIVLSLRDPELLDPTNPEGWVTTNLGAMLGLSAEKTHPALFAFLTSLDIFTIWFLVLAAIGFSAISRKLSVRKSAVLVFALWGVWIAGKAAWYAFTMR
ncbi:MAG: YIP1 family protein [Blastocatellia bacterium]|nr:YIP1 family protein [Blastocatellia bacterium]MCS7156755.1 YIP1 family protein [Blastocatellia bacterium]MCX7751503.1 YIP1 family protein [Blastocatellia bacterium]MDW8168603.1 YIP1 family protein [Acidobacteriota bacterium]MDW8256568.1 YIP1 family protein [Acidobacteriota bacterium]